MRLEKLFDLPLRDTLYGSGTSQYALECEIVRSHKSRRHEDETKPISVIYTYILYNITI